MRKILPLIIFLIMFTGICNAADRYQWMHSDDKYGYFFDTQTVKFERGYDKPNTIIIDVWLKTVFNDAGRNDVINLRIKNNWSTDGFDDLSYMLSHYKFNVKTNTCTVVGYTYYNFSGEILESYYQPQYVQSEWNDILPDSNAEYWLSIIKKHVVNNWNTIYNRS